MQQVKFFKGVESEVSAFEREVNAWIEQEGVTVVNVFGNIAPQTVSDKSATGGRVYAPSDLFIAVVFEKG